MNWQGRNQFTHDNQVRPLANQPKNEGEFSHVQSQFTT